MVNNDISNTDRLKSAICYIPIAWIVIYFSEKEKSPYLMKHIKYWTFIFIAYILVRLIFITLFLPIGGILLLVYLVLCAFLWTKAYGWEWVNIDIIDEFYSNNFKWSNKTTTEKKAQEEEQVINEDDESVVKTGSLVVDKIAMGVTHVVKDVKKDNKDEFYEAGSQESEKNDKKNGDILDF